MGEAELSRRLAGVGAGLETYLRAIANSLASRSWLRRHGLPLGVLLVFLWWIAYPSVDEGVRRLFGREGASWTAVVESLVFGLLRGLHPFALVGLAVSVVVAYAGTALLIRVAHRQRVDRAIATAEDAARRRVREWGDEVLAAALEPVQGWLREREELERLVGGREASHSIWGHLYPF